MAIWLISCFSQTSLVEDDVQLHTSITKLFSVHLFPTSHYIHIRVQFIPESHRYEFLVFSRMEFLIPNKVMSRITDYTPRERNCNLDHLVIPCFKVEIIGVGRLYQIVIRFEDHSLTSTLSERADP